MNFHVYFTVRRILYELKISLPGDSIFEQIGNHYDEIAFQRLCQEFNLDENPDFRWRGGINDGLGIIWVRDGGKINGKWVLPQVAANLVIWPDPGNRVIFPDGAKIVNTNGVGGQIGKLENISHGGKQHEWFSPYSGKGLTKSGYKPISPKQLAQKKWKKEEPTNSHDINKAASKTIAAGVGWYLFR